MQNTDPIDLLFCRLARQYRLSFIETLYRAGGPDRSIGRILNVSFFVIRKWRQERGLPTVANLGHYWNTHRGRQTAWETINRRLVDGIRWDLRAGLEKLKICRMAARGKRAAMLNLQPLCRRTRGRKRSGQKMTAVKTLNARRLTGPGCIRKSKKRSKWNATRGILL